jgi:hypothetical protein
MDRHAFASAAKEMKEVVEASKNPHPMIISWLNTQLARHLGTH